MFRGSFRPVDGLEAPDKMQKLGDGKSEPGGRLQRRLRRNCQPITWHYSDEIHPVSPSSSPASNGPGVLT